MKIPLPLINLVLLMGLFSFALGSPPKGFSLKVDETDLQRDQTSPLQSYSSILDKATPAVVSVTTQQVVNKLVPGVGNPMEDFLRRYYGFPRINEPRIEQEKVLSGIGSGVIVTPEGHTVTNAHVITDPRSGELVEEVNVQLGENKEYKAQILGIDRSTDIAVIKIESKNPLPFVTLANSDFLRVGDIVFATGNPLGIGKTVTMGIVSATRKSELNVLETEGSYENFIQTDASINRGNSGGALLDARGRLVGINTAIISQTGGSVGIGLAIPVNMVRKVLTDLVTDGTLRRGFLGVELQLEGKTSLGVLIESVIPNSAADKSGLRAGDKVLSVNEQSVSSPNQLRLAISQTNPGTRIPIEILRDGKKLTISVTLDLYGEPSSNPLPGVFLEPLSSDVREKYDIPPQTRGLVVTRSSGEGETFKEGVVIVEINGYQVSNLNEVREQLEKGINRFYVWYRGKYHFLAYRVP
ncbi:MAG: trypsin-like peptidase domain-containing protein [Verrucomicrobiota bacterium]|nr:trypsin-like peptidase domain-containing protein [Verrucomicrobiota bacterium]